VSLNRCEDALLAYLRAHPDEERFWHGRVNACDRAEGSRESRAAGLERELRAYAAERGRADPSLREALGAGTVRLRNLAEYLLAAWTPPRVAPKRQA
jgi:hypothetical protein